MTNKRQIVKTWKTSESTTTIKHIETNMKTFETQ
jgi:hypothetical protein